MIHKKVEITCIDTNVLLRFLLEDNPVLYDQAKKIFEKAGDDLTKVYLDEVILAEAIWVLLSVYKLEKQMICQTMTKFLTVKWLVNPRKKLMIAALALFSKTKLHYPDCWLYVVANDLGHKIETFDLDLMRLTARK